MEVVEYSPLYSKSMKILAQPKPFVSILCQDLRIQTWNNQTFFPMTPADSFLLGQFLNYKLPGPGTLPLHIEEPHTMKQAQQQQQSIIFIANGHLEEGQVRIIPRQMHIQAVGKEDLYVGSIPDMEGYVGMSCTVGAPRQHPDSTCMHSFSLDNCTNLTP